MLGGLTERQMELFTRRGDIAYVPQRSSVDWDFPATALDVVAKLLELRLDSRVSCEEG